MIKKIHLLLLTILILSNQSTFSQNNLSKKEILDSIIQVLYHSKKWISETPLASNPKQINLHHDNNFSLNENEPIDGKIINPNHNNWFIYGSPYHSEWYNEHPEGFKISYYDLEIYYPSQNGYGLHKAGLDYHGYKLFFKNLKNINIYINENLQTIVYLENSYNEYKLFSYVYQAYEFSYSSLKLNFDKHENAIKFYKLIKLLKDL
jgi:hypothetical protein